MKRPRKMSKSLKPGGTAPSVSNTRSSHEKRSRTGPDAYSTRSTVTPSISRCVMTENSAPSVPTGLAYTYSALSASIRDQMDALFPKPCSAGIATIPSAPRLSTIHDSVGFRGGGVSPRLDGSGSDDGSDDWADGRGAGEQATARVALRSAAQQARRSALGRYSPMLKAAVPALVLATRSQPSIRDPPFGPAPASPTARFRPTRTGQQTMTVVRAGSCRLDHEAVAWCHVNWIIHQPRGGRERVIHILGPGGAPEGARRVSPTRRPRPPARPPRRPDVGGRAPWQAHPDGAPRSCR